MSPTLNYDLTEIPDIVELTPGRAQARLVSCTKGKSKNSGNPTLTWTWKLLTGKDKGSEARSWTSLQDNALFGLKQHLVALGFKKKVNNLDTDDLIGKKVLLVIGLRPMANDKSRMIAGVTAVLPLQSDADADDDDDDEEEKPAKKAKKEDDDDGDEEEDAKPKKKKPAADDDEDAEEPPRKKRATEDDDEDEKPKSKLKTVPKSKKKDDDEEPF